MISNSNQIMLTNMKIHLTSTQKDALELMHDTTRDGRVRDRISLH
ncbi:hypothetical protein XNW1_3020008 [Xenorhabdus nematophila str. Websteri]|nr:hypothetical protein XNW1_3020008 [Xenorhabdus nematophila str. Websteri]